MLVITESQKASLAKRTEGMSERAAEEYRLMFYQLTEVQKRCTELIQESRSMSKQLEPCEARCPHGGRFNGYVCCRRGKHHEHGITEGGREVFWWSFDNG